MHVILLTIIIDSLSHNDSYHIVNGVIISTRRKSLYVIIFQLVPFQEVIMNN